MCQTYVRLHMLLGIAVQQAATADTWLPIKMTWFAATSIPPWRIGFDDVAGNVFYSN